MTCVNIIDCPLAISYQCFSNYVSLCILLKHVINRQWFKKAYGFFFTILTFFKNKMLNISVMFSPYILHKNSISNYIILISKM